MGEDQELRYVCKFCSKSFQCGRSLGGHMRSHIINTTTAVKQLNTNQESTGYILRENPKKTWRLRDHSTEDFDKFCKQCGRSFQSWKALYGHMKYHSSENDKTPDTNRFEDAKLVMDSKSDDETEVLNRRSKRISRYRMMTPADSSFSFTCASSSAAQEQEEVEVAMCLIMLSKDSHNWDCFDLIAESSDHNSVSLDAPPSNQTIKNTGEIMKQEGIEPGICASGMNEPEDFVGTVMKKGKTEKLLLQLGKGVTNKSSPNQASHDSSKRKFGDHFDPDSSRRLSISASGSKFFNSPNKRDIFECTSCNKIFHSHQALGGHRASHRKIKGCFASGTKSRDSCSETTDRGSVAHFIKHPDNRSERTGRETKHSGGHECSICLKVFSSGQALGGHKKSHLVHQQPSPEIGKFVDLNFPAGRVEEENSEDDVEYKPWWIGIIRT